MADDTQFLQRASLFYKQRRYPEAEREVRQYLSSNPEADFALQLLADILSAQGQHKEALKINEQALGLSPANDELLAQQGLILYRLKREKEAIKKLREAIQLNPIVAEYHGLLGEFELTTKNYDAALAAANRGLQMDPENTFCLNVRAKAQVKLKRGQEALDTIASSLEQQPENSYTHANLGWSKLEMARAKEAQEHFREALRLDPTNEYAQAGMVEAIKSRNLFYRLFLRYVFWMNRMSAQYQWAFIIGIYIGFKIVQDVAETNPSLAPFLQPLLYAYIAFALSTWFFEPISNLFLFLHPYGKFLLDKKDKISAMLVAGMLLIGMAAFAVYLLVDNESDRFLLIGLGSVAMMIPLSSMNSGRTPKDKRLLRGATIVLALLWFWSSIQAIFSTTESITGPFTFLFLGVFAFQWLAIAKNSSRY